MKSSSRPDEDRVNVAASRLTNGFAVVIPIGAWLVVGETLAKEWWIAAVGAAVVAVATTVPFVLRQCQAAREAWAALTTR